MTVEGAPNNQARLGQSSEARWDYSVEASPDQTPRPSLPIWDLRLYVRQTFR